MRPGSRTVSTELKRERARLVEQLDDWLETPMLLLGFAWLALLVAEFVWGLSPLLERFGTAIWVLFVVEFGLKLGLAPAKLQYLKRNWLTVLALMVPALRIFRVTRVVRLLRMTRAARGMRLFRLFTSLKRGVRSLRSTLGRQGFGYVLALTVVVTTAGAAGMYAFERDAPGGGLGSYGDALWWTAMLMTTAGSDYWPLTAEGRVLCFLLAIYAFAVFGYVTATLATFFLGREAAQAPAAPTDSGSIARLCEEIAALRTEVRRLTAGSGEGAADVEPPQRRAA